MNLVVTVNLDGTYIPSNVMESHVAAAARWGANYLQMLQPWGNVQLLWWSKMRLHRVPVHPASRIVYLDGDTLVRSDCPSLFDEVPRGHVGAVQNRMNGLGLINANAWWERFAPLFKKPPQFDPETYINGGVLVMEPEAHALVWELVSTIGLAQEVGGPMVEQTLLNMAIAFLGVPVVMLPSAFNTIGPEVWQGSTMDSYIWHFAPTALDEKSDKQARMREVDWRAVPAEVAA